MAELRFALAGNPNCGKTTLFNNLTGSKAHVGNWPGVTVEKRAGSYRTLAEPGPVTDLPGIYSLSPYTPEEIVTRNYILDERPDLVINIVDATNLERNLYLTTQLLEIDVPVVIALNMTDIVEKSGDRIDAAGLERELGVPVLPISALKGTGVHELMRRACETAKVPRAGESVMARSQYAGIFAYTLGLYREKGIANPVFRAVKMLEGDEMEVSAFPAIHEETERRKEGEHLPENVFDNDFEAIVADARYTYITKNCASLVKKKKAYGEMSRSDRIDRVLTHRIWGIPIFLVIMLLVFHLTFSENLFFIGWLIPEGSFDIPVIGTDTIHSPGVMLANAMGWATDSLGGLVQGWLPAGTWYASLVCDGLLAGVFAVLSFIPQIMLLFLFLSILEDSGYMARVAFIMDRAFRRFGLSGKAFMPLIMCFGCAVPGIMATRTLENAQERRRTVMLTPFFSCGAKLPIWAAFAGVFAHSYSGLNAELVVYSMYLLGIVVAVLAALLLKKTIVKGDTPPFIMELPAYHAPQFKNTVIHLWEKLKHYLVRAATIIAGAVVVIWFLSHFSIAFQYVEESGDSILGGIGKILTWLFIPLGFGMGEDGWKFVVAVFTGLIAKEMVVATMGTFAGLGDALDMDGSALADTALGAMMLGIGGTLGGVSVAIPAMFSFMAFNLLSVPCMAAVGAASGELRNKKHLWTAVGFWMLTAYLSSLFIFWFGVLITVCWWGALIVGFVLVALVVTLCVLGAKGGLGGRRRHASD